MPPTEELIQKAVARYSREFDRYLKLAARVADICRSEIVEGNAIRAQVTARAKSPKSLDGKLRRLVKEDKLKTTDNVSQVFRLVGDLAGVRVSTYGMGDEGKVVTEITRRFTGKNGVAVTPEKKDKHIEDPANFYRATHCEVFLRPDELVGTYANLTETPCEIQVGSMMAHVWNEIEHDMGYKPLSGPLLRH
jgi:ppGpp synthetase/RelA/SpoT-type nucleotidyltranferase